MTVLSTDPEAILDPSGLYATDRTWPLCPLRMARRRPSDVCPDFGFERCCFADGTLRPAAAARPSDSSLIEASHRRTVPFINPVAIFDPSGENATDQTRSSCPRRTASLRPVAASHSRTELSFDPEAIREPSGLNATDQIGFS